MAKLVTVLRVFVASPSDVSDERAALENVVRELNSTWGESFGVKLELVKWETHAYPGVASDAQEVINTQIGDDYDIFVGILSTRFGSPTTRALSGTAEEFNRAYYRFQQNPTSLRVMFYFKDSVGRFSDLDLNQYGLVKEFQKSLGEKGLLYWTFTSTEEFVNFVRLHLTRQLQDWAAKQWGQDLRPTPPEQSQQPTQESTALEGLDSDIGYLDLVELGIENLGDSTASIERMLEELNSLTDKTEENTPKLTEAGQSGDLKKAKNITNFIADRLEQYAKRMDTELPIFSTSYSTGIEAIVRAAILWRTDFQSDDKSSIETAHSQVKDLVNVIAPTREQMNAMRMTVAGLPRITSAFNTAKKHTIEALMAFDRELEAAHNLAIEAERELRRILDE